MEVNYETLHKTGTCFEICCVSLKMNYLTFWVILLDNKLTTKCVPLNLLNSLDTLQYIDSSCLKYVLI